MKKRILIAGFLATSLSYFSQKISIEKPENFALEISTTTKGKIDSIKYHSKSVGSTRKALIYTPPGFSKDKKYPVLYLLHGIGGDEREWYRHANPQNILDNLYAKNLVEPMIVVLPNGRAMKDDSAKGNIWEKEKVDAFAHFEKDLLEDLIPYIEKNFPVKKDREHRSLAGLSMGGGQSLNFGLNNIKTFSWVGGFSSAPNTKPPKELLPNPKDAKKLNLLWISCGDKDNLIANSKNTHDYLASNHIPHIYYVEPGGHDFEVWKNDLYLFSQLLFKKINQDQMNLLFNPK